MLALISHIMIADLMYKWSTLTTFTNLVKVKKETHYISTCLKLILIILGLIFSQSSLTDNRNNEINDIAVQLVEEKINIIRQVAQDPAIISALTIRAKQLPTLEQILRFEQQWLSTPDDKKQNFRFPTQATNKLLQQLQINETHISEIIVTDANGATVYSAPIPSDYWQGDEAKFIQPALHHSSYTGIIEFDSSSKTFQVQLSTPILRPETKEFLGAFIVGIELPLMMLLDLKVDHKSVPE